MRTRVVLIGLISSMFFGSAIAQDAEYDDMYFTSKDRAKLNAGREQSLTLSQTKKNKSRVEELVDEMEENPTDSYSARNVNPEYTSRSNSEVSKYDNEDYFDSNFRNQSQFNNWNRGFNSWYNNPWYSSAYYSSGIYGWNSPYYGSYYDYWGNPWNNPYYRSGWSSSFSYHWGNSWNYGWNSGYGWNNAYGWNCPFNGYNSYYGGGFYGPSYAWGPSYGWSPYRSGWYNAPVVVVVGNEGRSNVVYGKRASRGTSLVQTSNNGSRSRQAYSNRNPDTGGRVNTRQDEYYKPARRTYSAPNSSSEQSTWSTQDSRSTTQHNRSSSWSNSDNNRSNSSYSGGRSSSSGDSGTRTRATSSGSGSNGRSRGRD